MDSNKNAKTAKTHKGKLHLQSLLPKEIEDPKHGIFVNSANTSQVMRMILNDLVNHNS